VELLSPGIILMQTQLSMPSVSVEEIYGTIPTTEALQLAVNVLQLPQNLTVPSSLPPLIVTFGNVIASQSNSVCDGYKLADAYLTPFAF
jgi:hypothetical protein